MTLTASEIRAAGLVARRKFLRSGEDCGLLSARPSRPELRSASTRVAVVPALQRRAKVKPIAAQIDALVPSSEPLYAVDPDYQPFLFYMRSRLVYVSRVDDLPADRALCAGSTRRRNRKSSPVIAGRRCSARPILTRDRLPKTNGDSVEGERGESLGAATAIGARRRVLPR